MHTNFCKGYLMSELFAKDLKNMHISTILKKPITIHHLIQKGEH